MLEKSFEFLKKHNYYLLFIVILICSFTLYIQNLFQNWGDYDQGVYMLSAKLLYQGFPLYKEVFLTQGPLFIQSIALMFHIFGVTVFTARLCMVLYFLLGLTGFFLILTHFKKSYVNFVPLILYALSLNVFVFGRAVEAELPSLAVYLFSFYFMLLYRKYIRRELLIISATLFFLACLFKLTEIYLLLPLILFLIHGKKYNEVLKELSYILLTWFICGLLLLILNHSQIDSVMSQYIGSHLKASGRSLSLSDYFGALLYTLMSSVPLIIINLIGLLYFVMYKGSTYFNYLIISVFVTLLFLLYQKPAFEHDFVILSFYFVIISDFFLLNILDIKIFNNNNYQLLKIISTCVIIISVIIFYFGIYKTSVSAKAGSDLTSVVTYIDKTTKPTDYIITDYQEIAFRADRDVPPQLVDTSSVTLSTKQLTTSQLIYYFKKYNVKEVVVWSDRFQTDSQDFINFLNKSCKKIYYNNSQNLIYGKCGLQQ